MNSDYTPYNNNDAMVDLNLSRQPKMLSCNAIASNNKLRKMTGGFSDKEQPDDYMRTTPSGSFLSNTDSLKEEYSEDKNLRFALRRNVEKEAYVNYRSSLMGNPQHMRVGPGHLSSSLFQ